MFISWPYGVSTASQKGGGYGGLGDFEVTALLTDISAVSKNTGGVPQCMYQQGESQTNQHAH